MGAQNTRTNRNSDSNSSHNTTHKTSGVFRRIRALIGRNRLGEILVTSGVLSPQQLLSALHTQKQTQQPLGQVLLRERMVSRPQLAYVLVRQHALRSLVALTLFAGSVFGVLGQKRAQANNIKDIPSAINLTVKASVNNIAHYPALLGTEEERSYDIAPFTKWSAMFKRFDHDVARGSSKAALDEWHSSLQRYKGQSIRNMAVRVNNLMNKKRYISDKRNWGKSDYWATPVEFMQRGGDCEDFAIAKYSALRALGVPESRLRIAIVQDTVKHIPHAVLVVYTEDGPYILDNQIKTLINASRKGRYRPIYSINRTAWWLHSAPQTTILASAR